jgi:hypothetical protein
VADILITDVVTPDDENVGFLLLRMRSRADERTPEGECDEESFAFHTLILFG